MPSFLYDPVHANQTYFLMKKFTSRLTYFKPYAKVNWEMTCL